MGYVMSEEEADDHNDYQRELAAERAPKVRTHHAFPPIPDRQFDWCAYFDGEEEGLQGWGPTEQEALEDLKRVCQEAQEYEDDIAEQAREHERELAQRRGY